MTRHVNRKMEPMGHHRVRGVNIDWSEVPAIMTRDALEWQRLERANLAQELRHLADRIERGDVQLGSGEQGHLGEIGEGISKWPSCTVD